MTLSIADIRARVIPGYASASPVERALAWARPSICPFHLLADAVPEATPSGLDIGCGTGLFLNTLATWNRIEHGLGVDLSTRAVASANTAAAALGLDQNVQFLEHNLADGLPAGSFDLVSMIDVMHHIPPATQLNALREAADKVADGGLLVYKDMVSRPLWRASANRLHDLVLARQWIHYLPMTAVVETLEGMGFTVEQRRRVNMWWYGHEWVVLRKNEAARHST